MSIASIGEALENPSVTQLLAAYPTKEAFDAAVKSGKIKPTTEAGVAANIFNRIVQSALANQAQAQAQTTVFQDNTRPQTPPQMGLAAAAAQPQMPQRPGQGLDQVPVPPEMFDERRMAGGGIVAFQAGGPSFANMYTGLGTDIEALRGVLGAYPIESPEEKARRRKEEQAIRLMEIGLGVAGGESPYFASNLKGALPGLRGAAEDIRAQRKEDVAMQMAQRAETGKLLEGVLSTRGKAAESAAAESRLQKELASRESIAGADREAREEIERANRESREAIASLPNDKERAAQTIFDEAATAGMPISMEQAITRATAALNPAPDRYNALSNRLTAANKEIAALRTLNEYKLMSEKDPKKIKAIQDDFQAKRQEILRNYAISEADLKELNTAGRPSATGATKGSAIPAPPAGFQLTPPPYSPQ